MLKRTRYVQLPTVIGCSYQWLRLSKFVRVGYASENVNCEVLVVKRDKEERKKER